MQAPNTSNQRSAQKHNHHLREDPDRDIIMMNQSSASKNNVLQTMMSQDSINQYVEESQREAMLERKRLQQQEQERKNFASQIISQGSQNSHAHVGEQAIMQNHAFAKDPNFQKSRFGRQSDSTSKKERLQDLLEKTEQYTRFILQQNLKSHREQQRKKFAADILNGSSEADAAKFNGKSSISKRKQKRSGKQAEASSDEENEATLTRLTTQPSVLQGPDRLKDYQIDGLNWMVSLYETGINGILADEMGLGKTVQTISLIAFLKEFKQIPRYHLLIMPKSVVGNWLKEFQKWLPQVKVVNLIARKEQREEILKTQLQPGKFDVLITTYEGVRICQGPLMKFDWEYIIIDEAHKIKNEDSSTAKIVRKFRSKYRLLLTGTPLQNNLHELWSLLNFLLPEIFTSSDDFDDWFDLQGKANSSLTDAEKEKKNDEMIKQLHKILRPFMLRRIKREVEKSLLPKIEMHINVGITETQKSIYRQLLKKSTIEKASSTSFYKNILMQLRKVCNHPYLFQGIEPEDSPELGEHLIKTSGKMQVLDKLLKKAKSDNSQTLIFSGFTSMLDILEDYCRFREYNYCRLDGNTELDERQSQIDDFTSPDTNKFIFLISTRAGGLGLNLMTANTVVLYDSDWNPQMDLQAMDRAHRIGQKKQVRVYRLITKNTMEEKMVEKQTMKLKLDSLIIQKGRMAPKNTALGKEDLQDMVNYGADAIFEIGSQIDDDDIEDLIRQGEEKAKNLADQAEQLMKEKFDMINFEMNTCNLYQFEDVDYLKEKRKDAEDALKKNVIALMETETNLTSRRKFQKSLAESSLCPNIFSNGNIGVSNEAKKKRLAKVQDFRFFPDPERLKELIEIEMESKFSGYIQGGNLQEFTPEMKIEKELIESKGFPDWDRRDFQKFIQALELYATNDYQNISKYMENTKTVTEVAEYARVFFEKVDLLNDAEKIKAKINRAQANVNFNMRAPAIIRNKMNQYENPYEEMNMVFATQKSKFFSRESDILLLCLTDKIGFGNWSKIKTAVRRENRCRLDHLFTSRSDEELKKRVIYLVQCLEKEEEEEQKKKASGKKEKAKPSQKQLDDLFDQLMKEAEEKAIEQMQNLSLNSVLKFDKETEAPKESQSSQPEPSKKEEADEELNEVDRQMIEDERCEFDQQSEEKPKKQKKEPKAKKNTQKKAKEESDSRSVDSGIRVGHAHISSKKKKFADEDEEDEILRQELMRDAGGSENSSQPVTVKRESQVDSNKQTIETEYRKPSGKSVKQSNLADWVNLSEQSKQMVGTKRNQPDRRKPSEFNVSKK